MGQLKDRMAACMIGVLIAVVLGIPTITSLIRSNNGTGENRSLAPLPKPPQSTADLLKYTPQLELWVNDHFGLRAKLISLNNKLRHSLFNQFTTIQVISGRQGRIFLSAHATTMAPYSAITTPCGDTFTSPQKVAVQLNALHESFRHAGMDARIMIVPSSPVIYQEDLPAWLEARCKAATSPIELTLASTHLLSETRKAIYYPKTEMLGLKEHMDVFPKTWFHWAGAGPREVAGLSVQFFWNISTHAGKAIAEQSINTPSDISHIFPGVRLVSLIEQPDHGRSQIEACMGPSCFPSLGSAAAKLQEVTSYRNPAAPHHRIIILSDSFGTFIAGWYSRYFREVMHFSTNSLNKLNTTETHKFKAYIKEQAQTGHLLLLYHDGSVLWDRPAQDHESLFIKLKGIAPSDEVDGS
jgi:hypothetical protein